MGPPQRIPSSDWPEGALQPSAFSLQPSESSIPHPFDQLAPAYDDSFTRSRIGALMRRAVWDRLDALFPAGSHVLELGCGTGADAIHLAGRGVRVLATDASAGMVAVARASVERARLGGMVEVRQLDMGALAERQKANGRRHIGAASPQPPAPGSYDGVLSNFGALNCVADLAGVLGGAADLLRPGGVAVLCVMGPLAPWEWAWYLGRGEPGRALRRLRPGGSPWRGLTIRYPTIGALRRAAGPGLRLRRVCAVGALIPPSYMEAWAARRPALLWAMGAIERRFATMPPLPWLADHYLAEFERM